MFPPMPFSFIGECAQALTHAERATQLTRKLRQTLASIVAEFGDDFASILARCEERWPASKHPHLDNTAFAREIHAVLSERHHINREYHLDLFPPADLVTQTEAARDRGITPQAVSAAIRTERLRAYSHPDGRKHRPGDRKVSLSAVRQVWAHKKQ